MSNIINSNIENIYGYYHGSRYNLIEKDDILIHSISINIENKIIKQVIIDDKINKNKELLEDIFESKSDNCISNRINLENLMTWIKPNRLAHKMDDSFDLIISYDKNITISGRSFKKELVTNNTQFKKTRFYDFNHINLYYDENIFDTQINIQVIKSTKSIPYKKCVLVFTTRNQSNFIHFDEYESIFTFSLLIHKNKKVEEHYEKNTYFYADYCLCINQDELKFVKNGLVFKLIKSVENSYELSLIQFIFNNISIPIKINKFSDAETIKKYRAIIFNKFLELVPNLNRSYYYFFACHIDEIGFGNYLIKNGLINQKEKIVNLIQNRIRYDI